MKSTTHVSIQRSAFRQLAFVYFLCVLAAVALAVYFAHDDAVVLAEVQP